MLSSEDKPSDISAATPKQESSKTTGTSGVSSRNPNQQLEREQIFQLIESVLCFEACLYHQVLPLKLVDKRLLLGIVNPADTTALDYVKSIISYWEWSLEIQAVPAETQRIILSEYLNYKNKSEAFKLPSEELTVDAQEDIKQNFENTKDNTVANDSFISDDLEEESEPGENTLLLFDSNSGVNLRNLSQTNERSKPPAIKPVNDEDKNSDSEIFEVVSADNLPVLRLPLPESFSNNEELCHLSPKRLLKELLARVLAGGIGRLYLERQPYQGRILWSLNGIVQSIMEELPLSVFQGVLNELKRLSSLPRVTITQAKQAETECLYQQQRLLLRLRVMPGMYGEEATLQVLRGAALKFYQQQQVTRLSRDALGASQQLSYKVHELQQRLALNIRDLNPEQQEALDSLNEIVENLDHHLRVLTDIPSV